MTNKGLEIDDILAKDEEILWRGKPKKSAYFTHVIFKHLGLILLGLIFGFLPILAFIILPEERGSFRDMVAWITLSSALFIMAIVQIIMIIKECLECKNIEYALTNNRILLKSGIIGMDYKGLQYSEIGYVNLDVGVLDRIFKVGNIKIKHANSYTVLYHLADCYKIYKIIQTTILDIQTDIEYPNALRPDENPGYDTKSKNEKGE